MKLKTLKDLVFSHQLFKDKRVNLVREDNLRIEAIKWVKHFEKAKDDANGIKMYEIADKCEGLMGFIIHFFNITEEELK